MKKSVKTIAGIGAGAILFALICCCLNYIYVTDSPWERILFHSYYEQDNIDNVFMGSSHVYCGVDPFLLDEINGDNNFNMSTSGQRWDDTYFLLKQVADDNKLKHVYLECSFWCTAGYDILNKETGEYEYTDYIDDPSNFSRAWNITDYMRPSVEAANIRIHSSNKDNTIETIFPFVRYRQNLFNGEAIAKNLETKRSEDYRNNVYKADEKDIIGMEKHIEFREKGYNFSSGGTLSDLRKLIKVDRNINKYGLGVKSEKYMRKCLDLCKDRNIPVTLFVVPIYDTQLISTGDYDSFVEKVRAMAGEYGTELYDFNLVKDEYLDIKREEYFKDIGHLNGAGSDFFTPFMWDVFTGTPEENADMFYASYAEKLASEPAKIYGLYFTDHDASSYEFTVASNRDDMDYRISRTVTEDNYTTQGPSEPILEYGEGDSFVLPSDQHGVITIEAKRDRDEYSMQVVY